MEKKKFHIRTSDLRGYAKIVADSTIGITDVIEAVQNRIIHPPYLPSTPIQHLITGISSIVFGSVRTLTKWIGGTVDKTLSELETETTEETSSIEREAAFAIMNGVAGDYLAENHNPIAIPMQFRYNGASIQLTSENIEEVYPQVNGRILLMIHGLCMNDLQWNRKGHNHGEKLARELNFTPVYLHYNSGLHISTNGHYLSSLLEQLIKNWPTAVESLTILTHSMGGLVCRSAIYYGKQEKNNWTNLLDKVIFLGTPHHGAKLEQAGSFVDHLIEATHYAKPFARIGKMRSAGIKDLRHSSLVDEDWVDADRFKSNEDSQQHISLPLDIKNYAIAAMTGNKSDSAIEKLAGDGLVDLDSALGKHSNPEVNLDFEEANSFIVENCSHLGLLNNLSVYEQIRLWLT